MRARYSSNPPQAVKPRAHFSYYTLIGEAGSAESQEIGRFPPGRAPAGRPPGSQARREAIFRRRGESTPLSPCGKGEPVD